DACEEGGLVMNDTGRSHFLLKNSGLSDKRPDDLKLHVAGDISQHRALQGLMLRLGKQGQIGQHTDWAWHGESGDGADPEGMDESWCKAYNDEQCEWSYDQDYGWTAKQDGEWYFQEYDDIWARYDENGDMTEYYEADQDDHDTYFGGK
ncbi:unnamed protein product, partial [Prorocentrum cordatum]